MRTRALLVGPHLLYPGLIIMGAFTLLPFLWLVSSSFQYQSELLSTPPHLVPSRPTLDNYVRLFTANQGLFSNFTLALRNSVVVALLTTVISLLAGTPAGYAFARLDLPRKGPLLLGLLVLVMLPAFTVLIPLFVIAKQLSLLNTWAALVLAYTGLGMPFVVWIMHGYFQTLPKDLEDAARIDGCSRFGAFLRIALPLSAPGLVATAIFTFLGAWDEFIFALVFTSTYAAKTLPVALAEFQGRFTIDWGLMTSGGVLASVPPVLVALLLQRYLVTGLTSGGVKA